MRRIMTAGVLALVGALGATPGYAQQGVGAAYGARDPATCPSRTAPTSGPPSVEQATQYLICDSEKIGVGRNLYLYTDVQVQVGNGRPYDGALDSLSPAIDPAQTVYPIRGDYTFYQCATTSAAIYLTGGGPGKNCSKYSLTGNTGTCYRSAFNEWHCDMGGGSGPANAPYPPPLYPPPAGH